MLNFFSPRRRPLLIILLLLLVILGLVSWLVLSTPAANPVSTAGNETKGGLISFTPGPSVGVLPTGPTDPLRQSPTQPNLTIMTTLPTTVLPGATSAILPTVAPATTNKPTEVPSTVASPTLTTPPAYPGLIPYKIRIPAIAVDTFVERVGVTRTGTMDVPKNIWNTAWFGEGGYKPGQIGNAVIAGHLDAPGSRAVFWDLDKLKPGDSIYLTDPAGNSLTFGVIELKTYGLSEAPLENIFGPASEAHLNLITCSGVYSRSAGLYNKRLIVYTRLIA